MGYGCVEVFQGGMGWEGDGPVVGEEFGAAEIMAAKCKVLCLSGSGKDCQSEFWL